MKKWVSLLAAALLLVSVIAPGLAETADETADLLVVGAGPAGLSAAVSAVENGAEKVIVIEKTGKTGGNLNVTSGTLVGADTIIQREDGLLEDSVDMLYQDMIDTGSEHGGRPNSNLLYKYSELVGPAVDWLWENGLKDCEFTTDEEGHKAVFAPEHKLYSYPRSYKPKPIDSERYKSATHEVLDKLVAEHADKIEIVFNTEAKHLHANDQGQIVTVEAVDADGNTVFFTSRHGVVMATGGYAANQKMMSYFKPTASGIISSSLPGADGYGMRMVQEVGGDIAEYAMDIFPTITMGLPSPDNPTTGRIMSTKTAFAGGIWVNLNGERFVNETNADIYVREKALENQPEASMYEVYTDKIHDDLLEIPAHNNMMAGFFDLDAGKPYIVEADSLEELADQALQSHRALLIQSGVRVETRDLDQRVYTDGKWVCFLLGQLLQNAARYRSAQPVVTLSEIGRAHVRTPVTHNNLVCRLLTGALRAATAAAGAAPPEWCCIWPGGWRLSWRSSCGPPRRRERGPG